MEAYFQNMVEELRQIRRDLHKIPELGLKEYKTSAYIREKLEEMCIRDSWIPCPKKNSGKFPPKSAISAGNKKTEHFFLGHLHKKTKQAEILMIHRISACLFFIWYVFF